MLAGCSVDVPMSFRHTRLELDRGAGIGACGPTEFVVVSSWERRVGLADCGEKDVFISWHWAVGLGARG